MYYLREINFHSFIHSFIRTPPITTGMHWDSRASINDFMQIWDFSDTPPLPVTLKLKCSYNFMFHITKVLTHLPLLECRLWGQMCYHDSWVSNHILIANLKLQYCLFDNIFSMESTKTEYIGLLVPCVGLTLARSMFFVQSFILDLLIRLFTTTLKSWISLSTHSGFSGYHTQMGTSPHLLMFPQDLLHDRNF